MAEISLFRRLYRGESNVDFIGSRKKWYTASAIIILICVLAIVFRGFNFSIDFVGGDEYRLPVKADTSITQIRDAVSGAGAKVDSVQTSGNSTSHSYIIQTDTIKNQADEAKVRAAVYSALEDTAKVSQSEVTYSSISGSWGGTITTQAVKALIWFLVVVSAFIAIRFRDWRMALAAFLALCHDLILTAGVYAIVGFTVSPSTVVGLLTILGFSLYDTVVVFDKVDENSRGLLATSRYTYGEAANMAVNQTLMRSINTSIIGLLPVAGLLFVGAGILGVGTLEDLALVLFVGMLTGAYSSLFLATPWLVDLKMLDPRFKNHAQRVTSRREAAALKAAEAASSRQSDEPDTDYVPETAYVGSVAPRVGAKPAPRAAAPKRPGARPASGPPSSTGGKRRA
jgi:preprotein translocase subunit SecF